MAHNFHLLGVATILVTLLILSPSTTANSPVLDIDGNPLEVGSEYYVLTAGRGAAGRGGLTHAPMSSKLCPTFVAQLGWWQDRGDPVRFYPSDSSQKQQITVGDDINIAFIAFNAYCRHANIWKLTFNKAGVPYVATNGAIGNPEAGNWFKIETAFPGDYFAYKIVYCSASPAPHFAGTVGNQENCQQLDATTKGPMGLSYLSLVPIDQSLPFFGFVFKKVAADTAIAY